MSNKKEGCGSPQKIPHWMNRLIPLPPGVAFSQLVKNPKTLREYFGDEIYFGRRHKS